MQGKPYIYIYIFFGYKIFNFKVFNEFNSRKLLRTEINIFEGLFNNWLFWLVIVATIIVQYGTVTFGGKYVGVSPLTLNQHLACIAIGSGSIFIGIMIKVLPAAIFNRISIFREEAMDINTMDSSLTSKMRRKSSVRLGTVSQS